MNANYFFSRFFSASNFVFREIKQEDIEKYLESLFIVYIQPSKNVSYREFNGFGQAKFPDGGSILGSSQFSILPQLPQKMMLGLKVVKIDSKISNLRESVTYSVDHKKYLFTFSYCFSPDLTRPGLPINIYNILKRQVEHSQKVNKLQVYEYQPQCLMTQVFS